VQRVVSAGPELEQPVRATTLKRTTGRITGEDLMALPHIDPAGGGEPDIEHAHYVYHRSLDRSRVIGGAS